MNRIERLAGVYGRHIAVPWQQGLAGIQRVLFAVYEPVDELRLRARIAEFELATRNAHHEWLLIDLTDAFPRWMAEVRYRDSYFRQPEKLNGYITGDLKEFTAYLIDSIQKVLMEATKSQVVALLGIGTLFGLTRVSKLVDAIAPQIPGRLLVFFPGEYSNNNYRLLDARDGWNYLAVPLQAHV